MQGKQFWRLLKLSQTSHPASIDNNIKPCCNKYRPLLQKNIYGMVEVIQRILVVTRIIKNPCHFISHIKGFL